jgi:glycerol dehydrogenase
MRDRAVGRNTGTARPGHQQEADMTEPFQPASIYARNADPSVRVMIAPTKYIQGPGVLNTVGLLAQRLGFGKVGLLASRRGHGAEAAAVKQALESSTIDTATSEFGGESSLREIEARVADLSPEALDVLFAIGGGKCVDAGKCIAERLGVPVIIVPTLASNDAPCSALAVLYTEAGVMSGAEFFPNSPIAVIVDTDVIAAASERYLVSGMGDAMATWYEAKVCAENPAARTVLGTRPTITATAMSELCAHTLYDHGEAACEAVRHGAPNESLEQVVEANTLLSGIGFESGGLAGAHGYAQGYTVLPSVEEHYLHGEMVAMGVMAQLMMEDCPDEARRVGEFFVRVGLPVHLGQMGLSATQTEDIEAVVQGAMSFAPFANLPFPVDQDRVRQGMLTASVLGEAITAEHGEQAFRRIR